MAANWPHILTGIYDSVLVALKRLTSINCRSSWDPTSRQCISRHITVMLPSALCSEQSRLLDTRWPRMLVRLLLLDFPSSVSEQTLARTKEYQQRWHFCLLPVVQLTCYF